LETLGVTLFAIDSVADGDFATIEVCVERSDGPINVACLELLPESVLETDREEVRVFDEATVAVFEELSEREGERSAD